MKAQTKGSTVMKTDRIGMVHVVALLVCGLWSVHFVAHAAAQAGGSRVPARTIPYDPSIPVEQRLLPGDTAVFIEKLISHDFRKPPYYPDRDFTDEIRGVAGYEAVAVIEVTRTEGVWMDGGSWLRTRVTGRLERLLRGDRSAMRDQIQFEHHNGATILNGVHVVAGFYQEFVVGQRYLVSLSYDRSWSSFVAPKRYLVNTEGRLAEIPYWDNTQIRTSSSLPGRALGEVVDALMRVK